MKPPANDVPLVLVKWYAYAKDKTALLIQANEGIEMTRRVVRMASDQKLLAPKQFEFSALQLNECGWLKSRTSTNSASCFEVPHAQAAGC